MAKAIIKCNAQKLENLLSISEDISVDVSNCETGDPLLYKDNIAIWKVRQPVDKDGNIIFEFDMSYIDGYLTTEG